MKVELGNYVNRCFICAGLAIVGVATFPDRQHPLTSIEAIERPVATCHTSPTAKPVARTELFFGLRKPNGTEVNNAEFQRFLDREVTPRFPDGFTLLTGNGQFKNTRGVILQERAHLLILLYPVAIDSSQKIEQIRKAYMTAFQQQSVLRADELACASF